VRYLKRTFSEESFTIGLEIVYTNWNPHAATNSENIPIFFLIIYSGDFVTAGNSSIMEQLVKVKRVRVPSVRSHRIFPNKHRLKTIQYAAQQTMTHLTDSRSVFQPFSLLLFIFTFI
jgi:hypothetical protein